MITAAFIFLTVVSGFLLQHQHPIKKLKLHRYEGQYLYLRCALDGILCLVCALLFVVVVFLLWEFLASHFNNLLTPIAYRDLIGETLTLTQIIALAATSALTLGAPYLWSGLSKLRLQRKYPELKETQIASLLQGTTIKDSPLDTLLHNAQISGQPVMLTLIDRKVYVCTVVSSGEPNETQAPDQEITVRPIRSGYRDKDTLEVSLNTDYQKVEYEKDELSAENDKKIAVPIQLVVRQNLISSATFFNKKAFKQFGLQKDTDLHKE